MRGKSYTVLFMELYVIMPSELFQIKLLQKILFKNVSSQFGIHPYIFHRYKH